jgi:hypothetical protein
VINDIWFKSYLDNLLYGISNKCKHQQNKNQSF